MMSHDFPMLAPIAPGSAKGDQSDNAGDYVPLGQCPDSPEAARFGG